MASFQASILSLLITYGCAQTTALAPTTALPTTPPSFKIVTFQLTDQSNLTCAELTMALKFDISYENTDNKTQLTTVFVPEYAKITGTCVDDGNNPTAIITLQWGQSISPYKLEFVFTGHKYPPDFPTTDFPTTDFPTTAATTIAARPARRKVLASVMVDIYDARLESITFNYSTEALEFHNPKEKLVETAEFNTNDEFAFGESEIFQCKSQMSFAEEEVRMTIKNVLFSPFNEFYDYNDKTICSLDAAKKMEALISAYVYSGVWVLIVICMLFVILSQQCKKREYEEI